MKLVFAFVAILFLPVAVQAITIDTVPVGNPGNSGRVDAANGIIVGAVSSSYRISTTEVTNTQFVEFLNDVAASDSHGLFYTGPDARYGISRSGSSGSYTYSIKPDVPGANPDGNDYTYGDKPVVFVSWTDAARFTNWLNNGATPGASTEIGTYTMSVGASVTRNANSVWFLPNENEWYKAAYHKKDGVTNHYWNYPTSTDTAPNDNHPEDDTGNSANYNRTEDQASYPFTTVGAYTQSLSPYGTRDQGGNAKEWTETAPPSSTLRVVRGGAFDSTDPADLSAAHRFPTDPTTELEDIGFRVATLAFLPGDYSNNGIDDAADFVRWRKFLGQSTTLPNDGTPGTSATDYDAWRTHFGQISGSGPMLGPAFLKRLVPEPSSLAMLGLFAALSMLRRKPARPSSTA